MPVAVPDLQVVQLAVDARRYVDGGDVEDDLLAVGGQDPPLAHVALLEGRRADARRGGVHVAELGRSELDAGVLKQQDGRLGIQFNSVHFFQTRHNKCAVFTSSTSLINCSQEYICFILLLVFS